MTLSTVFSRRGREAFLPEAKMMAKASFGIELVLVGLLVVSAIASPVGASGSRVVFTRAVEDLGQGGWGGGPLFADGTAAGHAATSLANGAVFVNLVPTGWLPLPSTPAGAPGVDICFNQFVLKGPPTPVGPFCISGLTGGFGLPITGTLVISTVDGESTLFRVTAAS